MHHGRHVELHHFFVQRIPMPIGQRRRCPMAPGRIRIQIAADESQILDAALEFRGAVDRRGRRRLRQLTDPDEVVRIQGNDAMDQVIAALRPAAAGRLIADVVRHGGRARRKDRQVGAAGPLQFQLGILQAVANLIVADLGLREQRDVDAAFQRRDLLVAKLLQRAGRGGVVAMAVDDHGARLEGLIRPIHAGRVLDQDALPHRRVRTDFRE